MPHSQRIFFAYPHADRSFAERLARSLAQEGLDLVKVDASAGGLEEVDRQVRSADSVLLLINARSKFDVTWELKNGTKMFLVYQDIRSYIDFFNPRQPLFGIPGRSLTLKTVLAF